MTTARWITTTAREPWVERPGVPAEALEVRSMADVPAVMVRGDDARQTIEGFGACFNEMGWLALAHLTESERAGVLDTLFTAEDGPRFTICRTSIGANDFSDGWYSYDEVDGDLAFEHFDIARDRQAVLPFIQQALARVPDLRLWASPWSPPTWMKRNRHYACALPLPGSGVENGLAPEQVGTEGTDLFVLDDEHLAAYARYFAEYVQAYRAEGVEVAMVMPQNEFNSPQVFPSCTWTPEGLARFVAVLGPEMQRLGVEVFLGTMERPDASLVTDVLDDPRAGAHLSGAGFQWAGRGAIAEVHRQRPDLRLYQTEQECGDGLNDWRFARHTWALMKQFLRAGATAYQYWNIALEQGGVSHWGWSQNSLVVVDPADGSYRWTHEFQLLRHVAAFVRPGAVRLADFSWTGYENQLVFRNPDGSVVVVVQNDLAEEQPYRIAIDGRVLSATLPADSFSTLVLPPA